MLTPCTSTTTRQFSTISSSGAPVWTLPASFEPSVCERPSLDKNLRPTTHREFACNRRKGAVGSGSRHFGLCQSLTNTADHHSPRYFRGRRLRRGERVSESSKGNVPRYVACAVPGLTQTSFVCSLLAGQAGVIAVREGPILMENVFSCIRALQQLRKSTSDGDWSSQKLAALRQLQLQNYQPQSHCLQIINMGDGHAIGKKKTNRPHRLLQLHAPMRHFFFRCATFDI